MTFTDFGTTGLLSSTIEKYAKTFEDNIFAMRVLLWVLKSTGSIENEDGGTSIVTQLMYAGNPNVGSYDGYDVFSTSAMTGLGAAQFDWKQFYGLLHISGIELKKNSGQAQLINLLAARIQQLELTMADSLNTMLFKNGAGNSGKDFQGLSAIVSASDPSWGDLGGIDRATYTWWKATTKAATSGNTLAVADMGNVYNTASEGNDHPNVIITTQTGYEDYEDLLDGNIRYNDTKMADGGFQNLMFKGAPVAFDDSADADNGTVTEANAPMWFLNTNYLKLKTLGGVWFTPSELTAPTNQDAFYKHILCYGNLVTSNCKRQGVLYDIHA